MELLGSVARERDACVLLVTHDTEIAAIADRCCTLHDGKLTEGEHSNNIDAPLDARHNPHQRKGEQPWTAVSTRSGTD